jgi:hypothetical protein
VIRLGRIGSRRWSADAAKMSRFGSKTERLFDWLLSDLCSRFGMRIGALGQVPTFRTISGAALWDSGPISGSDAKEWRGYGYRVE